MEKLSKVMIRSRNYWLGFLSLLVIVGALYFRNQVYTIYGGDAGDLVSAIVTRGIPHPPGYPLYTLLGVLINNFIIAGTAAWRVGFLSSIPAIFTILILFDLLFYLTKRLSVSFISVLVLAFSYPFWLYSEVAEVFSLNNLFTALTLWNFFHLSLCGKRKYLYAGIFILGLSLTHHHIILFLVPSLIFVLFQKRKVFTKRVIAFCIVLFLSGLLPYLYVFLPSTYGSPVNWLGEATFSNFMGLVTRATYGTFKAGAFIVNQPSLRLWDLYGFGNFAYQDFRLLGLALFTLGNFYLFKINKKILTVLLLGIFSYLFFLFYASFPLSDNFIVGTFERFVLPLYILITFFIAFGLVYFLTIAEKYLGRMLSNDKKITVILLISSLFFIYPLGLFILNFPRISILKNDFTAENFGRDLLETVPKDSIILIGLDTPLFNSQYVYYTQKSWQEVKLIHFHKLVNPETHGEVRKIYPELAYGQKSNSPKVIFDEFLAANSSKYTIFSKQAFDVPDGNWVPWGLLFRYVGNNENLSDDHILQENEKIWSKYQDPLEGSLSRFGNLLLSDVPKHYSVAHQEIGFWEAKNGYSEEAERHLLSAERLTPDDLDSYSILSQVYIQQGKCDEAKDQINYRISKDKEDASSYLIMSLDYSLCYKDSSKSSEFQKIYELKQKGKETPLQKL